MHNEVPQGLSSAIFTNDVREAENFLSAAAAIAASPTSTSARAARKSAARSAARRKPAAGAKAEAIRGSLHAAADEHDQLLDELPLAQGIQFGGPDEGSATA